MPCSEIKGIVQQGLAKENYTFQNRERYHDYKLQQRAASLFVNLPTIKRSAFITSSQLISQSEHISLLQESTFYTL